MAFLFPVDAHVTYNKHTPPYTPGHCLCAVVDTLIPFNLLNNPAPPPPLLTAAQPQAPDAGESVLERFTADLTQSARRNQLDPLVGRDGELRRLTHILLRRTKNNPVLIGESGACVRVVVGGGVFRHML